MATRAEGWTPTIEWYSRPYLIRATVKADINGRTYSVATVQRERGTDDMGHDTEWGPATITWHLDMSKMTVEESRLFRVQLEGLEAIAAKLDENPSIPTEPVIPGVEEVERIHPDEHLPSAWGLGS